MRRVEVLISSVCCWKKKLYEGFKFCERGGIFFLLELNIFGGRGLFLYGFDSLAALEFYTFQKTKSKCKKKSGSLMLGNFQAGGFLDGGGVIFGKRGTLKGQKKIWGLLGGVELSYKGGFIRGQRGLFFRGGRLFKKTNWTKKRGRGKPKTCELLCGDLEGKKKGFPHGKGI